MPTRRTTKRPVRRTIKRTVRKAASTKLKEKPAPKATPVVKRSKALARNIAGADLALRHAGTAMKAAQAALRLGRCEVGHEGLQYAHRNLGRAEAHASVVGRETLTGKIILAQTALMRVKEDFTRACVIGTNL